MCMKDNLISDLKTLVAEERQKDSCRRFRNTGSCPFEEACTFTHYTNQELSAFEAQGKCLKCIIILFGFIDSKLIELV